MHILRSQPMLVDQVYEAILSRIEAGQYGPDARLVQEEIAEALGVSRQPVQQALLLLRNEGVLISAPGRGLMVAPLDEDKVRHVYEIRASLDALAVVKAAGRADPRAALEGPDYLRRGREAVARQSISNMIAADMAFHHFLYDLSGNPLIAETAAPHWTYLRCVMGAVLMQGESPRDIWAEHEAILDTVIRGDVAEAERLSRAHVFNATASLVHRLDKADKEVAAAR
ncbi:MAG: GntR family transcriptional regulator [Burkholderiaceae bacterium]|nr:GntR family transcriptional regulator [Burkholderiaceae bacterium]